jgi:parallel beta-helix repeat protein
MLGASMGKSAAAMLVLVFLTAPCIIVPLPVNAGSKTIVVPDDYPTISSAIGNATAGDTIFVKKGTYKEQTLTINKTLSLIGEDADNTIISLHPPWVPTGGYSPFGEPEYFYDFPIKITANNVKVSGFKIISNSSRSPRLSGVGTQITGNNITTGLWLENAEQSITGNIVRGSIQCIGNNHTIANNNLDHVWIFGSEILVKSNTISDDVGIGIGARGNTVINNTIKNCRVGIAFWGYASNNAIYHNNFLSNRIQVQIQDPYNPVVGKWDNGRAFGGNYWSDYLLKYPNATEIGNSGIGDTPYVIDANNRDNYPLMAPFDIDSVTVELPEWASPPSIQLISPKNTTYASANVTLEFTINKQTSWIGYSLDGEEIVTVTGNTTLTGLTNGLHNVTVYAKDTFGNVGISETVSFTVEVPFPTTLVIVPIISVAVVGVVLLVYFKKRKHQTGMVEVQ